jgi:serine/threonine protein phosphatase PrpC
MPNQDAWHAKSYQWGNIVAVSDGVGSKLNADIGSQAAVLAVTSASRFFAKKCSAPLETLPPLIHALWRIRIVPYLARDCGATCLFALRIGERLILGRLGDGLIIAFPDDGEPPVVMTEEKDDDLSNYTDCLREEFRIGSWELREFPAERYPYVMLCTDGVAEDLTNEGRVTFPREVFKNGKNLAKLRQTLIKWPVRGHTDDKTIACLVNGDFHD